MPFTLLSSRIGSCANYWQFVLQPEPLIEPLALIKPRALIKPSNLLEPRGLIEAERLIEPGDAPQRLRGLLRIRLLERMARSLNNKRGSGPSPRRREIASGGKCRPSLAPTAYDVSDWPITMAAKSKTMPAIPMRRLPLTPRLCAKKITPMARETTIKMPTARPMNSFKGGHRSLIVLSFTATNAHPRRRTIVVLL